MKNGMMDGYMNHGDLYAHNNDSSTSLSGSVSLDSSFSSTDSTASWEMHATPSPMGRESYGSFDRESLSSSPTAMSGGPIDHRGFKTAVPYNVLGMADQMMSYDFQYATTMCSPFDDLEYVNKSPSMMFESSSPLHMETPTHSPQHFVDPTRTFLDTFQLITPSRTPRFDREGLSSSSTSLSSSPIDHQDFKTAVPYNVLDMADQSLTYSTPCHRNMVNDDLMSYDFRCATTMCSPFNDLEYVNKSPSTMFESSSPLHMGTPTLSPQHFVDPTQTFLDTFQPKTPARTPRKKNVLASSPIEDYSCQGGQLQYFMSPIQSQSPIRSSRLSASSMSIKRSSSTRPALAASAALHGVQETGRITKRCKPASLGNGITRVVAGKFFCSFPGCEKSENHAFKRQEHLKRHLLTHTQPKNLRCLFCPKTFQSDRRDNWKAHIELHAIPKTKGRRVNYFPEAKDLVERWDKERKEAGEDTLSPAAEIVRGSIRRNATRLAVARF